MAIDFRVILGVAGVPPHDHQQAYDWERKLHWLMLLVSVLAIPAYYLEEIAASPVLHQIGFAVDVLILTAFSLEMVLMLRVTKQKRLYLLYNWIDVFKPSQVNFPSKFHDKSNSKFIIAFGSID